MQALHITETRAIVPVTRKLSQLRFTLEDLIGPAAASAEEEAEVPGGQRGRLSSRRIGQLIPNAVLQCQKATSDFIELNLTYDRTVRIPEYIARERRYRTLTYTSSSEILWRPETGFCFVMDVPKRAVKAVTWVLSSAVLGYPGRLSTYDLNRAKMRNVIKFLTKPSPGGPGELVRAIFRDIEMNGTYFEEVNIRARDLNKLDLYKEVVKSAEHIHAISFVTPFIADIGRSLVCRVDSAGGMQIYSQRLPSGALRALLLWLEEMLAK